MPHCFFCKTELTAADQRRSYCPYCFPKTGRIYPLEVTKPTITHAAVPEKTLALTSGGTQVQEAAGQYPGYAVKGEIGRGGMGTVYLARELEARRDVALKVSSPYATTESAARFLDEALITAQLQHPGIIPIYAIAQDAVGRFFYTMRPVEGEALATILGRLVGGDKKTEQAYGLRHLIRIMISVCKTMQFAHERGVIHRDLKPSNIIVGAYDEVMVIDWGLAKVKGKALPGRTHPTSGTPGGGLRQAWEESAAKVWATYQRDIETNRGGEASTFPRTLEGHVFGTPHYMSPEQAAGEIGEIDGQSDIWTLGVILYEVATLQLPFAGNHLEQILTRIYRAEPPDPVTANPRRRVPAELAAIIKRCLRKDRKERYETLREMIVDLERWLEGVSPWRLLEHYDFSTFPDGPPAGLTIAQGEWEVRSGVLCGCNFGTILTPLESTADLRLELEAMIKPGEADEGEVSLLLSTPPPEKSMYIFQGYLFRVMAGETTVAKLHKSEHKMLERKCDFTLDSWHTFAAERTGTTVSLECDGEKLLTYRDFFPFEGNRAGLFSQGRGLRITKLRVYSRGASLTLSCLDLAHIFYNHDLLQLAKDYYTRIFSDHADREEGVEALFRTGQIHMEQAKALNPEQAGSEGEELLTAAWDCFERVEHSFFAPLGVRGKAMVLQYRREYTTEVDELLRALRDYPDYDTLPVIAERLRLRGFVTEYDTARADAYLTAGIERVLLAFDSTWASRRPLQAVPIDTLDLSSKITNIAALAGLSLKILTLAMTRVRDLAILAGMPLKILSLPPPVQDISVLPGLPLEALDLSQIAVRDISILAQLPLRHLSLPPAVEDITPLRQLPLVLLDLENAGVKDVAPLSGMPLQVVRLPSRLEQLPPLANPTLPFLKVPAAVADITGVRTLPLRGLDLSASRVTDLTPLAGMPLEYLALPAGVTDISPLAGMPLRSLHLFPTAVSDLSPMSSMPRLTTVSLYPEALGSGWEAIIRGLPGLQGIAADAFFTLLRPEEFWRAIDTGQLRGSRAELSARSKGRREYENSQRLLFRWISPGSFLMGSYLWEEGREEKEKPHYVCLSRGFFMATTPVRVRDFAAFIAACGYVTEAERDGWAISKRAGEWGRTEGASWRSPGIFTQSPDEPVVCVSWNDARSYLEWLSATEGRRYRLPTESEWEYCCRAGSNASFHGEPDRVCWHKTNSHDRTYMVGEKDPNAWGLYDMHGQVSEWCADWYGPYPDGVAIDPLGPESGWGRICRGGNWNTPLIECRAAYRAFGYPGSRIIDLGFRPLLEA
jgi:formylglycine-generating enzyme required for sulfatase activity/serine/threonine protein kinase